MRSNPRSRLLWSVATGAIALLALTVGTALSAVPSSTAYQFSSHPMISGTVVSVNDHQMVVDTDQGEQVPLEMDSRTMAPRDLEPGMVMRAEFLALEDCRFYAQRIIPIRSGMSTNRLQAYANTHDEHEPMARNGAAYEGYVRPSSENAGSLTPIAGEHSSSRMMTATPSTEDYQFSTRPMISGKVVSANDHRLMVETDQGQQVGLIMDSRTMLAGEVAPGSNIRAEFTQMKDGRYYAKRISMDGGSLLGREQAYAHTRDGEVAVAQNNSDCGFVSHAPANMATSAIERRETAVASEPVAQLAPERLRELPQTASNQPLILLLGFLALGSAGVVAVVRRLSVA